MWKHVVKDDVNMLRLVHAGEDVDLLLFTTWVVIEDMFMNKLSLLDNNSFD